MRGTGALGGDLGEQAAALLSAIFGVGADLGVGVIAIIALGHEHIGGGLARDREEVGVASAIAVFIHIEEARVLGLGLVDQTIAIIIDAITDLDG